MKDYLDKTIEAYDNAPEKFVSATLDMANIPEMEIMLSYIYSHDFPILDVGCGYGRDSQAFEDMGYRTKSIDMSKELLARARRMHPELEFSLMDVRKLDFPDSAFSGVWCNAVLLHLNDKDLIKSLKEIYRVLRPEGVIAVSFKEGSGSKEVIETFTSNLSRFYNYKNKDALNQILEVCEFKVQQSHVLNERIRFGSSKRDLNWVWSFATRK